MIAELESNDQSLYREYVAAKRGHDAIGFFASTSGRYPLCGRGRINTYAVFAEFMRGAIGPTGRVGCILPSGIATDDTAKFFFHDLSERGSIASLYDFDNARPIFPGVHRSYKFSLVTLSGSARPAREGAELAFFLHDPPELADAERRFRLSAADLALLNPNTRTCPIFRSRRDAELTNWIYRRIQVLVREGPPEENPWGVSFRQGLFNMTSDSHLFRTREQLEKEGWRLEGNVFEKHGERMLPLYEAKMIHHFDHRWASYDGDATRDLSPAEKPDPRFAPLPRYWVPEPEVEERLADRWPHSWLLGWRDITNSTNERTFMASVVPRLGVGNNLPISLLTRQPDEIAGLVACISSFPLDYASRFKLGGTHLNFFITHQLAVLPTDTYAEPTPWQADLPLLDWLRTRVLELTYTAWDLAPFARDLGYDGPPFRWDEARRFQLRSELDAAFFHLYGIDRDEVAYIMDTLPIVRCKDEATHGHYRTRDTILEIYGALQHATETGTPYKTRLDPPPANPRVAHPQELAP